MTGILQDYLVTLAERYSAYYDVEREKVVGGRRLAIFARSKVRNEKYFITKSIPIYGYENYQYGIVEVAEKIVDEPEMASFNGYLKSLVDELVKPHDEHMSTYLDGILVAVAGFTPAAISTAKRFKYGRMFKLGFAGWCDIRLVLVDLAQGRVFANRRGREIEKYYRPKDICGSGR
ncbi:MAG: hypothetical protein ACOYEK_08790 [bacterium]